MKKERKEKLLLRQQMSYNCWMNEVFHFPISSFQITSNEFNKSPENGPWASSLFNEDVRAHINSQEVPLYLKSRAEIQEVKYNYSPQGKEESQMVMDTLLNKGPKAAERLQKKLKINRKTNGI